MKYYESKRAVCPFYVREDGREIVCEGACRGCETRLSFSSHGKKKRYCRAFCRGEYGECLIARAMNEIKYGE